ncbi:hypothetical protein HU200_066854 [Digitaria exilis]|uniref:WRKY domain-containing protein n=1 Tax=Digitaria exilis TaxID=1010633 RepID=A0A834ZWJ2_9POAL|nr:hypothetical protein HU200_066854 [Digitaria exilis]
MELSNIMNLVRQLEVKLGGSQTHTLEVCKNLTKQISCSTQRSISLVTSYYLDAGRKRSAADAAAPCPLSDASDAPFKTTKKRKTATEKVKNQMRVRSAAGGDIPADDGHSWRKYGQKEILGAKHPRSYYRCTHRHSQGCMATKQVQRTDEDSTLFDVIYIGAHTCVQNAPAAATAAPPPEENLPDVHSLLQSLSSNLTSTPASLVPELISPFSAAPSTSENWGVSPATSDSNQQPGVSFPAFEFEVAAGDVMTFEFGEVVSARADVPDDEFDISSFFA